MKKSVWSVSVVIATCALLVGGALPAQASYSKGLAAMTCGNQSFPPPEIHVYSMAKGSITHQTMSAVHGNWSVSVGTSSTYFPAESHHWLRTEILYGNVTTSSNYSSYIQSASRNCK